MTAHKNDDALGYLQIHHQNDKSFGISDGARLYEDIF
jgi:hypothetical protein